MNSMAKYFTFLTIEKADSVLRKICKTYKRRKKSRTCQDRNPMSM